MPISAGSLIGTAQSTTSTSTLVITTTTAATRGQFIVVRVASDNASATTPTFTCADSAGNTYTTVVQQARNATANAGVSGAIMSAFVTNPLPSGGTITITLSTARAQKAAYAETFNDVLGLRTSGTANNSGASTAPTVTSPSATNGDLVVGAIAIESNAAPSAFDTDTTNGTWSTAQRIVSVAGGTATSRVSIVGQNKIVTADGTQTYNLTITSTDWAALAAVYEPRNTTDWSSPAEATTTVSGTEHPLTASGTAFTGGSADVRATRPLTATGTAVTNGSATLMRRTDWSATATTSTQSGGTTHALTASGTATTGGSADVRAARPLTASGAATTSGSAAIRQRHSLAASGTATSSGFATFRQSHSITATGLGTTSGSAVVVRRTDWSSTATATTQAGATTHPLTASGLAVTSGSVSVGLRHSVSASGTASTGGSAAVARRTDWSSVASAETAGATGVELSLTASGAASTSGSASISRVTGWSATASATTATAYVGGWALDDWSLDDWSIGGIGVPLAVTASGAAVTSGSAAIRRVSGWSAYASVTSDDLGGWSTRDWSLDDWSIDGVGIPLQVSADGLAVTGGSAVIQRRTGWSSIASAVLGDGATAHQLSASGTATADGSAVVELVRWGSFFRTAEGDRALVRLHDGRRAMVRLADGRSL